MNNSFVNQLQSYMLGLATLISSMVPTSFAAVTSNPNSVNIPNSSGTSRNWSGYAATNGSFTSISGSWTIPSASSSGHTAVDAMWVGIGGVKTKDLIQAGTQNTVASSGTVSTSAFYELLPDVSQTIPVTVKPGDVISVAINQTGTNQWQITFTDTTTNQSKQIPLAYSSSLSSAEWIEEAPSNGYTTLPLDNFGSLSVTSGATTQNGSSQSISGSGAQAITMVNNQGQVLATPSVLGGDDASFIVTRSSASSSQSVPQFDHNPGSFRRHGFGIGGYTQIPQTRRRVYIITPNNVQSGNTSSPQGIRHSHAYRSQERFENESRFSFRRENFREE